MRFADIDVPEGVLEAARDKRLVVFAGAGVSVDAPSNLPLFDRLVDNVSDGSTPRLPEAALDRHLGALESQGVDVQGRARRILGHPDSQPNALHTHLLRLFRAADDVRIVTTNFDGHFGRAAEAVWGSQIDSYSAPALPRGGEFAGIVHLHGALGRMRERLVLTAADFGRAYLTEGWATQFLKEMFRSYTVLFVGYSHDDPVMAYLARGLPPESRRYGITEAAEETRAKWKGLGIETITYPKRSEAEPHAALADALAAWADYAQMGALEHEARILQLATAGPPLDPVAIDYLVAAVRDPVHAEFFARSAKGLAWLPWLAGRDLLAPLFRRDGGGGGSVQPLARWIAGFVASDSAAELGRFLSLQPRTWNAALWHQIAWVVGRDPQILRPHLGQWVLLLRHTAPEKHSGHHMLNVLRECMYPDDRDALVQCLDHLTELEVRFAPAFSFGPEAELQLARIEISVRGGDENLRLAWKEVKPHAAALSLDLLPLVTARILAMQETLRAWGEATATDDPMTGSRTAIEPHAQDEHRSGPQFLIDAARDLIEACMSAEPEYARGIAALWARSDSQLLRRLAVHATAADPSATPDALLGAVIDHGWIYARGLRHEVFRLLKLNFANASEVAQARLIAESLSAPTHAGERATIDKRQAQAAVRRRCDLAAWLARAAPGSELAQRHYAGMLTQNPDYRPRDHLDLYSWMTVRSGGPQSPKTSAELRAMSLDLLVAFVASFVADDDWQASRRGLLGALQRVVEADIDWGVKLAEELVVRDIRQPDLWETVLSGLRTIGNRTAPWSRLVRAIQRAPVLEEIGISAARVLSAAVASETLDSTDIAACEAVADRIFDACEASPGEVAELGQNRDWLGVAVNHAGGVVAELWLRTLAARHAARDDTWRGFPDDYQRRFAKALARRTPGAELACVVLAATCQLAESIDAAWTVANIVPLFDWSRDARCAAQAWHGFLVWGQLSDPLTHQMLPHLQQCFERAASLPTTCRDGLARRLAALALYSDIHPVERGWLPCFIQRADPEIRSLWARQVADALASMDSAATEAAWTRWIASYWDQRASGVPRPFDGAEAEEMLRWALSLGPRVPDAVHLLLRTPLDLDEDSNALFALSNEDRGVCQAHPDAVARILLHALRGLRSQSWFGAEAVKATRRLIDLGAGTAVVKELLERLAQLACDGTASLTAGLNARDAGDFHR